MFFFIVVFFFFKQKTAYEMRISDWSSDVCSSDLLSAQPCEQRRAVAGGGADQQHLVALGDLRLLEQAARHQRRIERAPAGERDRPVDIGHRSEERRVGKECGSTCSSRR